MSNDSHGMLHVSLVFFLYSYLEGGIVSGVPVATLWLWGILEAWSHNSKMAEKRRSMMRLWSYLTPPNLFKRCFQFSGIHSWAYFLTSIICKNGITRLLLLNISYSVHTTGASIGNKILRSSQPIHMDGHHMAFLCCQGQSNRHREECQVQSQ